MATLADAVRLLEQGDWEGAHGIVQDDPSETGAWVHGVVHMIEGDMANAGYWYRRAHRALPDASQIRSEIDALKAQVVQDP